jgi:hypothetical protein
LEGGVLPYAGPGTDQDQPEFLMGVEFSPASLGLCVGLIFTLVICLVGADGCAPILLLLFMGEDWAWGGALWPARVGIPVLMFAAFPRPLLWRLAVLTVGSSLCWLSWGRLLVSMYRGRADAFETYVLTSIPFLAVSLGTIVYLLWQWRRCVRRGG